jgi:hypothetical protein
MLGADKARKHITVNLQHVRITKYLLVFFSSEGGVGQAQAWMPALC